MKLRLPSVTLICIDCLDTTRAIKILDHCKSKIDFGDIKLLTSLPTDYKHAVKIMPLETLVSYSIFMLTRFYAYVDTPHVLVVQRDGWVLNTTSWNPDWLELDYIGPLFIQYDKVGSGGFSLRSRALMSHVAVNTEQWDGTLHDAHRLQSGLRYYEDGVICFSKQYSKFKFASPNQAAMFAQGGNRNPKYFKTYPFGFHRTWQEIDFKTGRVDSLDTSKDLHVSYDHEIDEL